MTARLLIALLALAAAAPGATAAQKTAVFPFILTAPVNEEDFFVGKKATSPEELARVKLVYDEFTKLIVADGTYETVDLTPMAAEIEAKMPVNECNGCEIDLAKKSGAEVAFIVLVEKASATVLNLSVSEVDVAKQKIKRNMMAVIQGNTDDAWLGGVRWIVKNRVLKHEPAKAAAP
jgi:Protein of unknown function (DUF2380)